MANTLFRTSDLVRINVDGEKYRNVVPMDWSTDGKSILFKYHNNGEPDRLAIMHLNGNVSESGMQADITDLGNITLVIPAASPEEYRTLEVARFSASGDSIYFALGTDVYKIGFSEGRNFGEPAKLNGVQSPIDILSDGRMMYSSEGGKLMLSTEPDGQNARHVATIKDLTGFDLSSEGKKVLYRKYVDSGYGWASSVFAYYDMETAQEHVIPNINGTCGGLPRWAPNDYHFIFHETGCGRGWPGGVLTLSDMNGSFRESIVPGSDDNPNYFIFNPDGNSVLISFSRHTLEEGVSEYMGGPANFYIMTLAQPVPEFGLTAIILFIGAITLVGVTFMRVFSSQYSTKN